MRSHDPPDRDIRARPAQPTRPEAGTAAPTASVAAILALQRWAGNAAVTRAIQRLRPGHDTDWSRAHEHGGVQRAEPVQRSAVHEVLRSPGRPLDEPTRTEMEGRLGADFSDVRLHTDGAARMSAAEIGARAYTSGSHVVIGDGGADRHTLAHELVHVVQQRQGPVSGTDNGAGLSVSDPSDRFEHAAEQIATHAMRASPSAPVERDGATQRFGGDGAVVQPAAESHMVQRAGDSQPAGMRPGRPLGDVLPRSEWYRLYLDPAHHEDARATHPDNPGELYDHQESKGYQTSMTAAYDQYLDRSDLADQRVDYAMYHGMHDTVISGLTDKPGKSGRENWATSFPLRANSPTPSVLDEEIGGRKLMVKADEFLRMGIKPHALTWAGRLDDKAPNILVQTLYKADEVESLVTEILDGFYGKLDAARTDRERFRAIGWAVRTIHIVHPFEDTNRRLNVHVLLPRLLLAAGFQPVIYKDMDQLFQGGRSQDDIADALEQGQSQNLTSNNLRATAPQYERPWYENIRNVGPAAPPSTGGTIHIPSFASLQTPDVGGHQMPAYHQADAASDILDDIGGPGPVIVRRPSTGREELAQYLVNALQQAAPDADREQPRRHSA